MSLKRFTQAQGRFKFYISYHILFSHCLTCWATELSELTFRRQWSLSLLFVSRFEQHICSVCVCASTDMCWPQTRVWQCRSRGICWVCSSNQDHWFQVSVDNTYAVTICQASDICCTCKNTDDAHGASIDTPTEGHVRTQTHSTLETHMGSFPRHTRFNKENTIFHQLTI